MRLGQLSRQLKIETKDIVKFLGKEKIEVEDNPNTKLDESQINLVEAHFQVEEEKIEDKPEPAFQSILDAEHQPQNKENNNIETEKEEKVSELPKKIDLSKFETKKSQTSKEKNFFPAEDPKEEEIVKAELLPTEKIQLGGIKVVGKIDLPEKPKKEETKEQSQEEQLEKDSKNENSTESLTEEIHPLKKAKLVGVKEVEVVKNKKVKKIEKDPKKPFKGVKAKDIKAKKRAEESKVKKKKTQPTTTKPEPINKTREARRRRREREKESINKSEKSWWKKFWESFSL